MNRVDKHQTYISSLVRPFTDEQLVETKVAAQEEVLFEACNQRVAIYKRYCNNNYASTGIPLDITKTVI